MKLPKAKRGKKVSRKRQPKLFRGKHVYSLAFLERRRRIASALLADFYLSRRTQTVLYAINWSIKRAPKQQASRERERRRDQTTVGLSLQDFEVRMGGAMTSNYENDERLSQTRFGSMEWRSDCISSSHLLFMNRSWFLSARSLYEKGESKRRN